MSDEDVSGLQAEEEPSVDSPTEAGGEGAEGGDGGGGNEGSGDGGGEEDKPTEDGDAPAGEDKAAEEQKAPEGQEKAAEKAADKPRKLYRDDFEWGDVIGEGAYGEVQLATVKETGITYAVKILNKKHIIAQKKVQWVNREKVLLDRLRHPNIVDLFYTFSDPERLHFVLELCPNGELFDVLRKHKAFSLECARFASAEVVSALQFMHEKHGIAHRDLKPENILLGRGNHLKIVDFGTAKELGDRLARSSSFVGTAEYVSPELLKDKEAGLAADLWALGCMIYQLVCGKPPFRAINEYLTFQQIINRKIVYPENIDEKAKDLIEQLLTLDPNERLGNRDPGGYQELMAHPFFEGIDWDTLPEQEVPEFGPPDEMPIWPPSDEDKASSSEPAVQEESEEEKRQKERAKKKEEQQSSPWAPFLGSDELLIHHSLISKKKGLFAHKRQLILTDGPRLIYVDPEKMVVKGEIPWSSDLKVEYKSDKVFTVTVPNRVYKLDELQGQARKWVDEIQKCLDQQKS